MLKRLLLLAIVAGAALALVAWPRLDEVETGRTPEYPDLKVQEFAASEARVAQAVRESIASLPGWSLGGWGSGIGGSAVSAVHQLPWLPVKQDVSVKVQRAGGRSSVSIRSRSRLGPVDLGQNARNVRELQAELRRRLGQPGRADAPR
jgi:uncharacterized protein DUF1499